MTMLDPLNLVLLVALAILAAIAWRPASRTVIGALDSRADRIRKQLDDAQHLREEAQTLLAQYERKLHEGEAQAQSILNHATEEAARLERTTREQLELTLQRRTQEAADRIAVAEARALQDIRAQATALSSRAAERLLRDNLDGTRSRALIDQALAEVKTKIA
ncbi:MAG: F0F1 ATP synthase subunit B [Pseudomonadota bacterium]